MSVLVVVWIKKRPSVMPHRNIAKSRLMISCVNMQQFILSDDYVSDLLPPQHPVQHLMTIRLMVCMKSKFKPLSISRP